MSAVPTGLLRVNPVAKLGATLPAALALFVTRGVVVPAVILVVVVLTLVAFGAIGLRRSALLIGGTGVAAALGTLLLGLWVEPGASEVYWRAGPLVLSELGIATAAATSLRVLAIIALVLFSGMTTSPQDILLAVQQQLRVPYRYVHAARAALVIAPSVAENFQIITLAHKVRGTVSARGPLGWLGRQASVVVPLMAGGIRTGERLALAMDARAFGASDRRTERRILHWRPSDTAVAVVGVLLTAGIYLLAGRWGLLGTVSLW